MDGARLRPRRRRQEGGGGGRRDLVANVHRQHRNAVRLPRGDGLMAASSWFVNNESRRYVMSRWSCVVCLCLIVTPLAALADVVNDPEPGVLWIGDFDTVAIGGAPHPGRA